jgi:hypothetical protein
MKTDRSRGGERNAQARKAAASELAVAALSFIAADEERLGIFLALSGIGPESLRAAAQSPGFLCGVLDHVANDEGLLIAFAEHSDVDPADVVRARDVLAGEPWA